MNKGKIQERARQLVNEERKNPPGWWYISFADDDGFRGVVIVQGQGFITALDRATRLGINPGGEVKGMQLADDVASKVPIETRERLLSKTDLERHFGPVSRWDED